MKKSWTSNEKVVEQVVIKVGSSRKQVMIKL